MAIIKWIIDPNQSKITFSVRKLMVTTVHGNFEAFEGGAETTSENFKSLENIQFQALIDSIKTDDDKRDEHLKSADFFDMDAYPHFSFKARAYDTINRKLQGELTIRNITKPIVLDVKFPETPDQRTSEINSALTISGKVKRQDFGLTWNGKNEAGEIIVGDQIKLNAQVSFIKQPAVVQEAQQSLA